MTTIKASCPVCGEVDLVAPDINLQVCCNANLSTYCFDCPICADRVTKPADDQIIQLLLSGGVQAHGWAVPAEAFEPHTGPPVGYDDLLDFALALSRSNRLVQVLTDEHATAGG